MEKNRQFVTKFWQKAYDSLSPAAKRRHAFHMKSAERWELRLDSAVETWTRAAAAIAKAFNAPRRSPTH
jgi:hypothetical protein